MVITTAAVSFPVIIFCRSSSKALPSSKHPAVVHQALLGQLEQMHLGIQPLKSRLTERRCCQMSYTLHFALKVVINSLSPAACQPEHEGAYLLHRRSSLAGNKAISTTLIIT